MYTLQFFQGDFYGLNDIHLSKFYDKNNQIHKQKRVCQSPVVVPLKTETILSIKFKFQELIYGWLDTYFNRIYLEKATFAF